MDQIAFVNFDKPVEPSTYSPALMSFVPSGQSLVESDLSDDFLAYEQNQ